MTPASLSAQDELTPGMSQAHPMKEAVVYRTAASHVEEDGKCVMNKARRGREWMISWLRKVTAAWKTRLYLCLYHRDPV